jgi:hypothetical protein
LGEQDRVTKWTIQEEGRRKFVALPRKKIVLAAGWTKVISESSNEFRGPLKTLTQCELFPSNISFEDNFRVFERLK